LSIPDSEARKNWTKKNTVTMTIKLNRNTDAEVIRKLESEPSRQGYIKALIRKDIAK